MDKSLAEVARLFAVPAAGGASFGLSDSASPNFAAEVYPGYPGVVVAEGMAQVMHWGFPLSRTGSKGQKLKPRPVTNAREDKLASPFWRDSFTHRRCLIPVGAWAEAEGEQGRMTRTWYGVAGQEVFAVAGLWRPTAEWGRAFAMVMVDGCPQMAEVHDRMPVVLARTDWQQWLAGNPEQAFALCRTCPSPLAVDRTAQPWASRNGLGHGVG